MERKEENLCLGLALFLRAGVDAGSGLSLLAEEQPEGEKKALLREMAGQMDEGKTLSAVFSDSGLFPEHMCGLIAVGERTGRLEEALRALARYCEHCAQLEKHLRSALMYPAVLLMSMAAVIVVLLTKVLPVFEGVYASLGGHLTGIAGGLLALGQVLEGAMPLLCALLALAGAGLGAFSASERIRAWVMRLWRRYRGDRGVSRKLNTARFAQALAMGMDSGLTVEEALDLAGVLLEDIPEAKKRCLTCRELMERGTPPSRAMAEAGLMPAAECRLLEVGLRSGCYEEAVDQIARRLAQSGEEALEKRVNQVEPVLVAVTSLLVGAILLSVMLPLMNMMTVIG